jgi:hypothetical protein
VSECPTSGKRAHQSYAEALKELERLERKGILRTESAPYTIALVVRGTSQAVTSWSPSPGGEASGGKGWWRTPDEKTA